MSGTTKQALAYLGNLGSSLPTAIAQHRGNFYWKRANGSEDVLYAGVRDSSGVMKLRQLLTEIGGQITGDMSILGDLLLSGAFRDTSATGWTADVQTGMGTTPGAQTRSGGEYAGRISQATGSSTTAAGALWWVNFVNDRPDDKYTVFVTGGNKATNDAGVYCSNADVDRFQIASRNDPGASTTLLVSWFIVQRVS